MADDLLDAQNTADEAAETNAAAVALALDGATARPELSGAIAAFLKEQRRLMEEQREQLRDSAKRMRLGIVDQRFSIALKAAIALIGFAVAILFATMMWNAYDSGGLVIEPFSVPPDLAARGLTGEVVAAKLLDRMAQMQAETSSQRAPESFQNYWGQDIKVTIPDTGVSLGELDRFLNLKLGHATRISGEVVRTAAGVSVTARDGTSGSLTVSGSEDAVDPLMRDLAEQVYRLTQPYLYSAWLQIHGRLNDALPVLVALATTGPMQERGWGYLGWSNCLESSDGEEARLAMLRRGVAVDPHLFLLRQNIALSEDALSRPEQAIADGRKALVLLDAPGHGGTRESVAPSAHLRMLSIIDVSAGDYHSAAARLATNFIQRDFGRSSIFSLKALVVRAFAGEHDPGNARDIAESHGFGTARINISVGEIDDIAAQAFIAVQAEDWKGAIALSAQTSAILSRQPALRGLVQARITPFLAYAHARLGDFRTANALIAAEPDHCDICLRTRAAIAALAGDDARANWWFARAAAENPSTPFAYADWGAMLLQKGDFDGAIAKFESAHKKGPHFADPLEMWGEALMLKNRSDLALARFAEAARYAPNWGRLHLKWGEALMWSGDKTGAEKQFDAAAALALTPPEEIERARVTHGR
ncbi:MAG TPA: hypothetical protein VGG10_11800 [Rhizomicrobium sp.]|jgi:tetratricopeptide (TPR) repeat protein